MAKVLTRQRGNTWQYRFEVAKVDNKRKYISKGGFKTQKEAYSAGIAAKNEYDNCGKTFEPSSISVADYFQYYLENYAKVNCTYGTYENYKMIIKNHINPILGKYPLKNLDPTKLQEFVNFKYMEGFSKNYLKNMTALLMSAIRYAVYPCQFIKDDVGKYVKIPKKANIKPKHERRSISQNEFKRIIERFPYGTNHHLPLMIGYYTGMRIGEVMGLRWKDIDLENRIIRVNHIINKVNGRFVIAPPKTQSSYREIQFGETLYNLLMKWKASQNEYQEACGQYYINQYIEDDNLIYQDTHEHCNKLDLIMTKPTGEMLTIESFKYASKVINYELGIEFSFHYLRHTHATMLIENGAPIKNVSSRLGHSSIKTTLQTYTHDTDKMKNDTVDLFEKLAT